MLLQVKIYHGGFYFTMSQQGFYDMDIVAAVEHVGSETVAQRMCRKVFVLKPGFGHGAVDYHLCASQMYGPLGLFAGEQILLGAAF